MSSSSLEPGALKQSSSSSPSLLKRKSQSGSLAYGKISDSSDGSHADDWKSMQNIRVIARFRPPNKRELRWSKEHNVADKPPLFITAQQVSLEPSTCDSISLGNSSDNNGSSHNHHHMHASLKRASCSFSAMDLGSRQFKCSLDAVLAPTTTQKKVFYRCGLPMIMACLDGYNATIFAYGQSGSGKTYTMMGPETNVQSADEFGLVPRCVIYLFQKLDEQLGAPPSSSSSKPAADHRLQLQDYAVHMECVQIYKTQIFDLLNPTSKKKLVIKTNFSTDSVFIQNLRCVQIQTVEEAFKFLTAAQQNRIVSGHSLNEVSSRSHMLVMMTVRQRYMDGTLKTSKLNFGDLAGSEDVTKALGRHPDVQRKREAICINQSLSALTTAVLYLSRGQKPSFRDSPLTHILKDSLGGNSKTIMLVTASPHIYNRTESIRTLRFASTAKKVKNKATINEQQSLLALKKRIKELERENGKLRQELMSKPSTKVHHKHLKSKHGTEGVMSTVAVDDRDDEVPHTRKRSVCSSLGSHHQNDDEWGSDYGPDNDLTACSQKLGDATDAQNVNTAQQWHVDGDDDDDDDDEESNFELHEYMHQINEYRERLDREQEENETLQMQVHDKNIELESCTNKISELLDELQQNEQDFEDCKLKIRHLQTIVAHYESAFPSYTPETNNANNVAATPSPSPLLSATDLLVARRSIMSCSADQLTHGGGGTDDNYGIAPGLLAAAAARRNSANGNARASMSLSRLSVSHSSAASVARPSIVHQTNLLESLLSLHQRMEAKMQHTECELNKLKQSKSELQLTENESVPPPLLTEDESQPSASDTSVLVLKTQMPRNPIALMTTGTHSTTAGAATSLARPDVAVVVVQQPSPELVYESDDEKLSEWDLDVSTCRDSCETVQNIVSPNSSTSTQKTKMKKNLRRHLQSVRQEEKKLKQHLATKLKQDAIANNTSGWCKCFWGAPSSTSTQNSDSKENVNDHSATKLIEQYLKMQVKKELVLDKYHKKKKKHKHAHRRKGTAFATQTPLPPMLAQ